MTSILSVRSCILVSCTVLLLTACALSPTSVPTPTPSPSPTVTPQGQTWQAEPVLVNFSTRREDPAPFGVSTPPDLVLYHDGLLVRRMPEGLQAKTLSRTEICQLLNTVESTGFFEVEMASYDEMINQQGFGVVSMTFIKIAAWKTQSVRAEALVDARDRPELDVPVGLAETYTLLDAYRPADLAPYMSERLAVSLYRFPEDTSRTSETTWPLDEPSLASLYEQAEAQGVKSREMAWGLVLEGDVADEVWARLREAEGSIFTEGGELYAVSARPLLPYESLESAVGYQARIPSVDTPTDLPPLTCSPADGVLSTSD